MAKDRITMAKRQREVEKREKATRKLEKKEKRHARPAVDTLLPVDGKTRVLTIFRRYLMSSGQMLCLNGNELESNQATLRKLVIDGLLVEESFKGGYSLTASGFEAMKNLAGTSV